MCPEDIGQPAGGRSEGLRGKALPQSGTTVTMWAFMSCQCPPHVLYGVALCRHVSWLPVIPAAFLALVRTNMTTLLFRSCLT